MKETDIYSKIKKIAEEQLKDGETINRADLAYILKNDEKFDCNDDSELSALIYRAYEELGHSEAIKNAIITNDGNCSVVEQYELNNLLQTNNSDKVLDLVHKNLRETTKSISEAKQSIEEAIKLDLTNELTSVYTWLQGSDEITQLRAKSSDLMQNYGKMVDQYQIAEKSVKNDIHNFVQVRNDVNSQYLQYASSLIDIFGDSIKMVAPNLFNFDEIKWLDVNCMKNETILEFNQLDEKCTLLIGEIADNFSKTIGKVPSWMKLNKQIGGKGGLYGSLAVAAISYLNHWLDAQTKTTQMKDEYIRFKNCILHDRTLINGDLLRLVTIHKIINDLYIPKADAYARLSGRVLSSDLKELIDSIYNNPEIKVLKEKRDKIFEKIKKLETEINDHNENISLFNAQLSDWKGMIETQKGKYAEAKAREPQKPNIFSKMITLGHSQKDYEEKITDWQIVDGHFVEEYEHTIVDIKMSEEDLQSHTTLLEKNKLEYDKCRLELKEINKQISNKLICSPQQKREVLKHLKNIISLLNVAKNIVSSKLDKNLTETVKISNTEDVSILPTNMESDINNFINKISKELSDNKESISDEILKEAGLNNNENENLKAETSNAINKISILFDSYIHLQSDQMKSQLSSDIYQKELEKLKSSFKNEIEKIDNKSAILRDILTKANLADNKEDLRNALIELGDIPQNKLTEDDFEAMLRGENIIEI